MTCQIRVPAWLVSLTRNCQVASLGFIAVQNLSSIHELVFSARSKFKPSLSHAGALSFTGTRGFMTPYLGGGRNLGVSQVDFAVSLHLTE